MTSGATISAYTQAKCDWYHSGGLSRKKKENRTQTSVILCILTGHEGSPADSCSFCPEFFSNPSSCGQNKLFLSSLNCFLWVFCQNNKTHQRMQMISELFAELLRSVLPEAVEPSWVGIPRCPVNPPSLPHPLSQCVVRQESKYAESTQRGERISLFIFIVWDLKVSQALPFFSEIAYSDSIEGDQRNILATFLLEHRDIQLKRIKRLLQNKKGGNKRYGNDGVRDGHERCNYVRK